MPGFACTQCHGSQPKALPSPSRVGGGLWPGAFLAKLGEIGAFR